MCCLPFPRTRTHTHTHTHTHTNAHMHTCTHTHRHHTHTHTHTHTHAHTGTYWRHQQLLKEKEKEEDEIPGSMKCPLCKGLFEDAVIVSCCGDTFCDPCFKETVKRNDFRCPNPKCREKVDLAGNTFPNSRIRELVLPQSSSQLLMLFRIRWCPNLSLKGVSALVQNCVHLMGRAAGLAFNVKNEQMRELHILSQKEPEPAAHGRQSQIIQEPGLECTVETQTCRAGTPSHFPP